jgi:uncharacterized protein YjbI with pentapeptide repeats
MGANFTFANLREANFTAASFSGANLRGANLSGANLTGSNITQPQLDGACGRNETLPPGLTITEESDVEELNPPPSIL